MDEAYPRILLVDDEPIFCRNFKSYMEMHGYVCWIAHNGKEGMGNLQKERPDIIILDVLMPNMDGYTMLREMKKNNIYIPCIVVTGRERLKDLFEMEQISRFVTKPFELDRVKQIIDEVLNEEKEKTMDSKRGGLERSAFLGKKILLIEDELKLAENLKNYLEMRDFKVEHAMNGQEGLKRIEVFKPDLVLLDIIMPEMDGYSMLKQLRKVKEDLPVIILTGKDRLRDLFEVERIDGFLSKPFNLVEVEAKIKEVLERVNKQ